MRTINITSDAYSVSSQVFYSNFKEISGVTIPTSIKTESNTESNVKIEAFGMDITKSRNHEIIDQTIEEFNVNPKLDIKNFEIKEPSSD